ncbi:homoserine kinase [Buchnera aphidicola (Mollitrichosiphum nigrofasciatum)]|uniref:homoserine kinase n=1 Tax=Buchnera aphidicola TaxID=9 RepID=UPI0031B83BD0
MIKIYAPASIGNVSVGFDLLGVAIKPINGTLLGDCIQIKKSDNFKINIIGKFANQLPKKINQNIVWKAWKIFLKTTQKKKNVHITLEKNMPIGSGLGSSACSIVSSLHAMNVIFNNPLNDEQLLKIMGVLEGEISGSIHYDNVAPSYLGGMQLIINEMNIISQKIPIFEHWFWVVAWPGTKVSTEKARFILPKTYKKKTCIQHSKFLASFIHATYSMQEKLALYLLKDHIAEPYRKKLLPGFSNAKKNIIKIGALSCGISGSGPTLFAICKKLNIAEKVSKWLNNNYLQNKNGFVHICHLDTKGSRII